MHDTSITGGDCEKTAALETRFIGIFRSGVERLQEAARVYVELLDIDKTARERLVRDHGFRDNMLDSLERIGRGTLLLDIYINAPELGRLHVADQQRILDEPVPALVERPDGTVDELRVNLLYAAPAMRRQLLNGSHIRTPGEQRAWLVAESNRRLHEQKVAPPAFRVTASELQVFRPTVFKWSEIRRMMKGAK
jgi:hypothetical protein